MVKHPGVSDGREPRLSLVGRGKERGKSLEFGKHTTNRSCGHGEKRQALLK